MNKKLQEKIQKLYPEPLSEKEVQEATENFASFFELLIEIDQRNKRQKK